MTAAEKQSNAIITEMKEWLKDIQFADDVTPEYIDSLSDGEVLKAIDRHYDGGQQGFVNDCL